MSPEVSERAFEEAIECALLRHGPDACPGDATAVRESGPVYGEDPLPGGYLRRRPEDYDRGLCLIPNDVLDFLLATQPKEWERLRQHHGSEVKPRFLGRLSREIGRRGALDVLRHGVKDMGCRFRLAYFRPASGLNQELQRLHAANLFAEVRQLRYSEQGEHSLDLVLFLNGIPIFTAELKNPLNGQDVEGRHPAVPARPRPARVSLRLRALPGPLRRGSGAGVRDHAAGRGWHALPALQPGALRGRGGIHRSHPPVRAFQPNTCGSKSGPGTACSTSSVSSSTKSRRRMTAGARPDSAS